MARQLGLLAVVLGALACGKAQPKDDVPPVTAPLPVSAMAGQKVAVFPFTLMVAEEELGWADAMGQRQERRRRADSLLEDYLLERAPEVTWVLPEELRQAARQAPGMLVEPDRIGTAMLRDPSVEKLPDPMSSQMRNLIGVVGDRVALVPAAVFFRADPNAIGGGAVHFSVVLVDVRFNRVRWRTVAYGTGDDPWRALRTALDELLPITP